LKDKYLLSISAGVILVAFGILIYYIISSSIDEKLASENKTIGFEQLQELNYDAREKVLNNTVVEQFKNLVGETVDQVKDKIPIYANNSNP
jgi:hypothetical protein